MSHLFLKLNNFFLQMVISFFENGHIHNVVSTLINVMKIDVENNSIVQTLSNVVNMNVEIDNVNLTLFNVVNFNKDMYNVVSTLVLHCPTSRRHITLATTLRPRGKVFQVLNNVAITQIILPSLSNRKHIYLAEYLLIAAFVSFPKVLIEPFRFEKTKK